MVPHGLYNNILHMLTGGENQPIKEKNLQVSYPKFSAQLIPFISQSQHKLTHPATTMKAPGEVTCF